MIGTNVFSEFIQTLPKTVVSHKRGSDIYNLLQKALRKEIELQFLNDEKYRNLQPFGYINFPYYQMGNVDTLNLFDLDEIIIFGFYWMNKDKYKNVADLGANLGLHSIILSKCGFNIKAYEPDEWHFSVLKENISNNSCTNVELFNSAVSDYDGEAEFVRVLGNTTSSHILGDKKPYGELENIKVKTCKFQEIIKWADLIKMDVEGHEVVLVTSTTKDDWNDTDALIEISNIQNAKKVFDFFNSINVSMYSQKKKWESVSVFDDMPISYKEGTLFVSNRGKPFQQKREDETF